MWHTAQSSLMDELTLLSTEQITGHVMSLRHSVGQISTYTSFDGAVTSVWQHIKEEKCLRYLSFYGKLDCGL
jgi:hypothetical protein